MLDELTQLSLAVNRCLSDTLIARGLTLVSSADYDEARAARPYENAIHYGWSRTLTPHEDWTQRAGTTAQEIRLSLLRKPVNRWTMVCLELGLVTPWAAHDTRQRLTVTVKLF